MRNRESVFVFRRRVHSEVLWEFHTEAESLIFVLSDAYNYRAPAKRSQHCWVQHVVCVWPSCCNILRRVGGCWLKVDNLQHPSQRTQHVAVTICWVDMLRSFGRGLTSMPMFLVATYWAKMEHCILFTRIVNQYLERQQIFSAAPLNQGRENVSVWKNFLFTLP